MRSPLLFAIILSACRAQTINSDIKQQKAENLSILVFIPFTGEAPRVGIACKIATQMVLDEVNSRSDILPKYHIEADFRDEGAGSVLATKVIIDFRRKFEVANQEHQLSAPSPIVIGPFFSGGCKAIAGFAHEIDIVLIAVGCASPIFTANRKMFPNLYKIRSSGELGAYPKLHFIREIGKWSRIGIMTFAGSLFDYSVAAFLQKEAAANNVSLSYFDVVNDFDDASILALKQSDSRIIVLEVIEPPLLLRFVCQTNKLGITGSKYLLILHLAGFVEPDSLPDVIMPGCTKQAYFEQMKISYWIAGLTESDQPSLTTSLGYSLTQFDEKFNKLTNNIRPVDYDKRTPCHDVTLQAMLTLHEAEKELLTRNLTLKDYIREPKAVMRVVNSSAAKIEYVGIRIGPSRYSKRLEFDDDPQIVMQWSPIDRKSHIKCHFILQPNKSVYSYDSYISETLEEINWQTESGHPPRDSMLIRHEITDVPSEVFWLVVALSILTSGSQLIFLFQYLRYRKRNETGLFASFAVGILLFVLGCLIFDAGAVLLSSKTTAFPYEICVMRPVFLTLGVAFVQVSLFSRIMLFAHMKPNRIGGISSSTLRTQKTVATNLQAINIHQTLAITEDSGVVQTSGSSNQSKSVSIVTSFIITGNVVILFVWMIWDGTKYSFQSAIDPEYHADTDTYLSVDVLACHSDLDVVWILLLGISNGLMLAISAFVTFYLRNVPKVKAAPEFKLIRLAIMNTVTLFYAGFFLMVVLRSPTSQQIALSFILLVTSAVNSLIVFVPVIKTLNNLN